MRQSNLAQPRGKGMGYKDEETGQLRPPLPAQKAYHASHAKHRALVGGYGSGKTDAIVIDAQQEAEAYPRNYILIARRVGEDLRDTTQRSFFELLPQERHPDTAPPETRCNWNQVERKLTYPNGSVVIFRNLEDPERYRSLNLGAFYIDEAIEEGCEYGFSVLKTRLRRRNASRRSSIASNPGPVGCWIDRQFRAKRRNKHLYDHFTATSLENIHLPNDYLASLMELPDEEFQMYVMGEYIAARGAIFSQFRHEIHVVDPFPIPYDWPKVRALDAGINHPFVCSWVAVDPRAPAAYVYREWVQADLDIEANCRMVKDLSIGESYMGTFVDPSMKARQIGTGMPLIDQVRQHLDNVVPGDNSIEAGITRTRTLLSYDVDVAGRIVRPPRLFFFRKHAEETIRQVAGLHYEVVRGVSTGKPEKIDDDAWDALKYALLSLRDFDTLTAIPDQPRKTIQQECMEQAQKANRQKVRRLRPRRWQVAL